MPIQILIPANTFRDAVDGLVAEAEEKATLLNRVPLDRSGVPVYLSEEDKPILLELLKLRLSKGNRTRITQYISPVVIPDLKGLSKDKFRAHLDSKPGSFDVCLQIFEQLQNQPFELKIMDRWYPFRMPKVAFTKWNKRIVAFFIRVKFQMVRAMHVVSKSVPKENFRDAYGDKSFAQILHALEMRVPDDSTTSDQNSSRLVSLSIGLAEDYGKQVLVRGPVLEVKTDTSINYYGGDMSWETTKHIYEKEKAVIEPELEIPGQRRSNSWYEQHFQQEEPDGVLPFVRAFSLRTRTFLYTDFRNTEVYLYQTSIEKRLLLKPAHRKIIQAIFAADEETIKDLIPGKTGGICVLAWGNPGVGKTLTAEVYAEVKERPLYSLSVSEIGTNPQEIEKNLQRVFTRVERWNAVLLFDECDVFLSKRGDDIHQSAVVGMFLRLMDYYSGTMFLTTNRLGVVDDAIDSRLAFRIHYEDLAERDRLDIWKSLLSEAKVSASATVLENLAQLELDGRKIRNMVRAIQLTKVNTVTWEHVRELLPYIEFHKRGVADDQEKKRGKATPRN
jgi:hypothetical protein